MIHAKSIIGGRFFQKNVVTDGIMSDLLIFRADIIDYIKKC